MIDIAIIRYRAFHLPGSFRAPRSREVISLIEAISSRFARDDRSIGGCPVSSGVSPLRARPAGILAPHGNFREAQYCFFRHFNCLPDTRSQSALESTARPTVVPLAVTSRHGIQARRIPPADPQSFSLSLSLALGLSLSPTHAISRVRPAYF
jgi:hypothetical protein